MVMRSLFLLSLLELIPLFLIQTRPQDSGDDSSRSYGTFTSASSMAVDPAGMIYVLDAGENKVIKLSETGRQLGVAGGYGWGDQTFDHPYDLCAQNGLDVYIADYGNHRIQRYDRNLNFVSSFGSSSAETGDKIFGYPKSVAVSNSGSLFFIDGENKEIVKLTIANEIERTFGGFGYGNGKLVNPIRIRIDARDRVYVLDGKVIVVFDVYGNYLRTIGDGIFREPSVFAISLSTLYVLDSCSILSIDEKGNVLDRSVIDDQIGGSEPCSVRDIAVSHDALYLLTDHTVMISRKFFKTNESREDR